MKIALAFFGTIVAVALPSFASAQTAKPLPQGAGVAAKYQRDAAFETDPAILFVESFEDGTIADLAKRWQSVQNPGDNSLAFVEDVPVPGAGRRSLRLAAHPPKDSGGYLYRRLPREVDTLFLRFYVKFPAPPSYVHHFVHLGGYQPATAWPQGGAGERPRGDERVTVGIEPFGRDGRSPAPGDWNFYAYWHEMKKSAGGRYWGNALSPTNRLQVPSNAWQCVEVMMKLNDVGKRNGELALWLDGQLAMHIHEGTPRALWSGLGFDVLERGGEPFEGFDFRTSDKLRLNFVWLLHYVTESNQERNSVEDRSRPSIVQFDNVVAATAYIGPIQSPNGAVGAPKPRAR